ncbi:chemosensory receptor A [Elysia marginata]|uniref:Chemosensory receptor A n=1 Tax=Elysia marginata TaxID=1093978 RepID=A0AAV4EY56_9GAST|nr:chemosensory receptor A [Elysia marginata]
MAIRILAPLWVVTTLFGLVSNTTNIAVFLKAGAKDNVTVLLLSLSVSDFVFLILISPTTVTYLLRGLPEFSWPFDYNIPFSLLYWHAYTAYDISGFTSVSLGLMRCACVAMPLKFKVVFTRSRTVKWVMFLVVLAVSLRIPVLTVNRIAWRTDPSTNKTVAYLNMVNRLYMISINDILNRSIIINLSYGIMVICVVVLTFNLYQAAKMRRDCLKTSQTSDQKGLSSKDLQVVKSVVLVCTIFVLFQLPALFVSTIRRILPEFDDGKDLVYLFGILSQINLTCTYLNASVNIFVYYNYNSKYRAIFRSIVCCKKNPVIRG